MGDGSSPTSGNPHPRHLRQKERLWNWPLKQAWNRSPSSR
jgi:hypothetical protein